MAVSANSIVDGGGHGIIVEVECQTSNGLPGLVMVGLASKAVDEAKERIRSAFASSKIDLPRKRITINLAPADIPKDSSSFDLAIATAILLASKQINEQPIDKALLIGELGLDGRIRPVRGIIGKLLSAKKLGITKFFIPAKNSSQASLVPGITFWPLTNLKDFILHCQDVIKLSPTATDQVKITSQALVDENQSDFADIAQQSRAKRALEIAASGGHNVILTGPPGAGKSMLAKALPSILPNLNISEMLQVTHLHSLASNNFDQIISTRPFRSPHHSSSPVSILGGGQNPKPGEISLSHCGVLFLDELPEFPRSVLEALRQPLEDGNITVARAKDSIKLPARFILIATANPCPCGYYGSSKPCSCLPNQILNYQRKISGPILDRIDLYVNVDEVKHDQLLKNQSQEPSSKIKQRVITARNVQKHRYQNYEKTNSQLTSKEVRNYCNLSPKAEELLNQAAIKLSVSARSYMKIIKVARTIADLDGSEQIKEDHVAEALQYRKTDPVIL